MIIHLGEHIETEIYMFYFLAIREEYERQPEVAKKHFDVGGLQRVFLYNIN